MDVYAYISYKKVKEKYKVKTVNEVYEILAKIEEELKPIMKEGSYNLTLWDRNGERRCGEIYNIHMDETEENVMKAKSIFPELCKKFQIAYTNMDLYRKMSK